MSIVGGLAFPSARWAAPAALLLVICACTASHDLEGELILRRSEEQIAASTVVFEVKSFDRTGGSGGVAVHEFAPAGFRLLWHDTGAGANCTARPMDPNRGRLNGGATGSAGGTRPGVIENLGREEYAGVEAWRIRYRFDAPSIEGPYPVERTEWIATDDYRLLRVEIEQVDPFGLIGQIVMMARPEGDVTACPSPPELPATSLRPLTGPRLEFTYPSNLEMTRFLALGDSYTIGESVAEAERWPVRLVAQLRGQGVGVGDPEIIAQTGWTADELATAIGKTAPEGPYDLVSLLIGVNDQYRGRPLDDYREQFRELLKTAIGLADGEPGRVIVLSIPDWGVTPFAEEHDTRQIAAEIDAFNAVNREEAEAAGARYVDVTPASRRAATDGGLIAADGLHPSGRMYQEWAELVLPEALAVLGPG